jgi:hypothetical protein
MSGAPKYWFIAKHIGWGWGLPCAWQGWVVLTLFFGLVLLGAVQLLPRQEKATFMAYCGLLSLALVGVCWLTGEPPRWRGRGQ